MGQIVDGIEITDLQQTFVGAIDSDIRNKDEGCANPSSLQLEEGALCNRLEKDKGYVGNGTGYRKQ